MKIEHFRHVLESHESPTVFPDKETSKTFLNGELVKPALATAETACIINSRVLFDGLFHKHIDFPSKVQSVSRAFQIRRPRYRRLGQANLNLAKFKSNFLPASLLPPISIDFPAKHNRSRIFRRDAPFDPLPVIFVILPVGIDESDKYFPSSRFAALRDTLPEQRIILQNF